MLTLSEKEISHADGAASIISNLLRLLIQTKKRPEPPISRILSPVRVTPNRVTIIHLWMPVARHLLRPTLELERAALKRSSIWSCTGWGLHSFSGHPKNWCALTAPFHPYPEDISPFQGRRSKAVYFLLHFPSRRRDSTLWSTLPCGVRTFLRTMNWPSDRLDDSNRYVLMVYHVSFQ